MINPYMMHHYFKSIGLREKTDKTDSYGIAMFVSDKKADFFDTSKTPIRDNFNKYNKLI